MTAAGSGASCSTCAAASPGWFSWTCLGRGIDTGCPSETLHHPKDPRGPGEKPHRPDFLEIVDMPLDSGYVLIQPCVACWREPTAMSRLLRVSWLSAGRHSILERGSHGGGDGGDGFTGSQAPGNSGRPLQQKLPTAGGAPRVPPAVAMGHLPPSCAPAQGAQGRRGAAGPAPGEPGATGTLAVGAVPCPGRQAACMGLLQRPWGPSCCRQGPDRGDAPTTLMLESLPKGLPGWVTMDRAAPLLAHQPQPRVD